MIWSELNGYEATQQSIRQMIVETDVNNNFGRLIRRLTLGTFDFAVNITHIFTGALRTSHSVELTTNNNSITGRIFVGEILNPFNFDLTTEYATTEHDRGEDHEFYGRAFREYTIPTAEEYVNNLANRFN